MPLPCNFFLFLCFHLTYDLFFQLRNIIFLLLIIYFYYASTGIIAVQKLLQPHYRIRPVFFTFFFKDLLILIYFVKKVNFVKFVKRPRLHLFKAFITCYIDFLNRNLRRFEFLHDLLSVFRVCHQTQKLMWKHPISTHRSVVIQP